MRRSFTAVVAGAIGAVAITGMSPAFAGSATPVANPLAAAKQEVTQQIDARLLYSGIQGYLTSVDKNVPASDSNALLTGLKSDISTLQGLRTDVSNDATLDGVKADAFKVLALHTFEFVLPRVATVRDSDNLAAAEKAFNGKVTAYQTDIDNAAKAHKNVTAATQALADFKARVFIASVFTNRAHSAISLVRGDSGSQAALDRDGLYNFDSVLNLFAAIHDATTISHVTGGKV